MIQGDEITKKVLKKQYVPGTAFYSQVIDSLHDYAIFTVDMDLQVNSWNSGATKIFQYETDEIIGKPFGIIFTEEDKVSGIPKNEIDLAMQNGRSLDIRWHLRKDNSTFYADGLVFPLKDEDDVVIGYVKIVRDITARKASEDALKKYTKEMEDLNSHKESVLAILSHDLRSPLSAIIQGTEYLSTNFDSVGPELALELVKEIHAATKNQLDMLDYLVEWARIKYAAEAFNPTTIALLPSVNRVLANLKEAAALGDIKFRNEIGADCTVFADEKMVLSILQNLISNAIKHSHRGGYINLSVKESEGKITTAIQDSGTGIAKETLNTLFSPQVSKLTKAVETKQGAGIGLLLVKGFLEKNGGTVWVESEEGNGASFYFTLPVGKSKGQWIMEAI
jgi:PAS domain S-box-containing protein